MPIVPPKRPLQPANKTIAALRAGGVPASEKVALLGVRGYYRDDMGVRGRNDRGIYDDAMFLVTPSAYVAFNANTDPSVYRQSIAVLKPGLYRYRKGKHGISGPNPYDALRQASNVTVIRDGEGEKTDSPNNRFWINIHKGSTTKTSSLGCQTIFPDQWPGFIGMVYSEMNRYAVPLVPYLLIENT